MRMRVRTCEHDKCQWHTLVCMSFRVAPASGRSEPHIGSVAAPDRGRGVHATWLYTLGSIVFFIGVFDAVVLFVVFTGSVDVVSWLGGALFVTMFTSTIVQVRFCWLLGDGPGAGVLSTGRVVALVVPAAAAWSIGVFLPGAELASALPLWVSACLLVCVMPTEWRWPTLGVAAIVLVAHPLITGALFGRSLDAFEQSGVLGVVFYAVLLPVMLLTSLWWWGVVVQLDQHRRMAAELAVARERLRFASDLHDIQGHHLQVISLKAELAERLLEIDPDAAREHLHETRLIAKEALEETRSLVAGYRAIALDDELENAREVLAAAGANCELNLAELPTESATRTAFASVVREATTNILRHSNAASVRIALVCVAGEYALSISNDGLAENVADVRAGSGIEGLRDRLAAVGGRIETTTDAASARFTVLATVPVRAGVEVTS